MANRHYETLKNLENNLFERIQQVEKTLEERDAGNGAAREDAAAAIVTGGYHPNLLPHERHHRRWRRLLAVLVGFVLLGVGVIIVTLWVRESGILAPKPQRAPVTPPPPAIAKAEQPAISAGKNDSTEPVSPAPELTATAARARQQTSAPVASAVAAAESTQPQPLEPAEAEPLTEQPEPQPTTPPQAAPRPLQREEVPPVEENLEENREEEIQNPVFPAQTTGSSEFTAAGPPAQERAAAAIHPQPRRAEPGSDDYFKLKQWLHQAEELRRKGEWDSAIILYRKVWREGRDPAVANNLAASLLYRNRLAEAQQVLAEALKIAPDDPELRENEKLAHRLSTQ